MRVLVLLAGLIFVATTAEAAEPVYRNSRGELVKLTPERSSLLLKPAAGLAVQLGEAARYETVGPVRAWLGGLLELPLPSDDPGRPAALLEQLRGKGLVERRAQLFRAPAGGLFALDDQLILRFSSSPSPEVARQVWSTLGLEPVGPLSSAGDVILARAADSQAVLRATVLAADLPQLIWALPDFVVPVDLHRVPTDPFYEHQWYLRQPSGAHIQAEQAWDLTLGDRAVVVAVIDTGVDVNHPDFAPDSLVQGYDSTDQSNDPTPGEDSINAHGTTCSGLIVAAADNGEGMTGVCPGCSLMPIRMMDGATQQTQLSIGHRALTWAVDNGAWVLSNSWGIQEQFTSQMDMEPYYDAVRYARSNGRGGLGSVVLFASGNGDQWTGQAIEIGPNELAAMDEVMAIGGTGMDDRIVSYSSYGQNLSVVAPTGGLDPTSSFGIFTTDTVGDRGFSRAGYFWVPGFWGDENSGVSELDDSGNYTAYFNGTSAACPIAAGAVALTLSANPELRADEVQRIMEQTADKVGGPVYDENGHDERYGYGRINLARAVRAASWGLEQDQDMACAEDVNCLTGFCYVPDSAEQGLCAYPCTVDQDCPASEICLDLGDSAICRPACQEHKDCAEGNVCHEGYCLALACSAEGDCPAGSECSVAEGLCLVQSSGGKGSGCGCSARGPAWPHPAAVLLLLVFFSRWVSRRRSV